MKQYKIQNSIELKADCSFCEGSERGRKLHGYNFRRMNKNSKECSPQKGGRILSEKTNFSNLRDTLRFHKESVLNGARVDQFS